MKLENFYFFFLYLTAGHKYVNFVKKLTRKSFIAIQISLKAWQSIMANEEARQLIFVASKGDVRMFVAQKIFIKCP